MDVHSAAIRSKNMRAVRHKNTIPEVIVRKALHARGLRFRLNVRTLPGTPDIVFPKYRAVIFVHGCFWHGHACHLFKVPQTRTEFWMTKIEKNALRDGNAIENLRDQGWRTAIVWECALKGKGRLELVDLIDALCSWLVDAGHETLELSGV